MSPSVYMNCNMQGTLVIIAQIVVDDFKPSCLFLDDQKLEQVGLAGGLRDLASKVSPCRLTSAKSGTCFCGVTFVSNSLAIGPCKRCSTTA